MDDDIDHAPREMAKWNEYRGPHFTAKAGMGFLVDTAAYAQDAASKEQITMLPAQRLRDFRFVLGGSFPSLPRKVTWNVGVMYDAPSHSWFIRQTGVMIAVPKLWGNIFIGRSKEGFSLNKVMVGYDGWTMERSTMSDATIPILADGFKWLGYTPKHGFLWNFGYYNDWLSQGQSFSTYHNQTVLRAVWLPIHSDEKRTVFHLGVNLRNGSPKQGQLQFRSRPEAFPAPYFVDTGKFAATNTKMAGYETYYRKGPLLLGSEYWWVNVSSPSTHNPVNPRRRLCCDMVGHRRDACLQHGPGSLQRCHTQETVVLRRLWCCRVGRAVLRYRLRQRHTTGRQVLAIHSDGQLVPDGLPAPRGHLWHWTSGSIQPQRQYPVLPDSPSIRVLSLVEP